MLTTQIRALHPGTDLVTITIGGNDAGFGFGFADVRERFDGHGVCSADPWINGPSVPPTVGRYHPTPSGYRNAYLPALNTATTPT